MRTLKEVIDMLKAYPEVNRAYGGWDYEDGSANGWHSALLWMLGIDDEFGDKCKALKCFLNTVPPISEECLNCYLVDKCIELKREGFGRTAPPKPKV